MAYQLPTIPDSLTIAGHTVLLGGSQNLAASDLTNGTTGSGGVALATNPAISITATGGSSSATLAARFGHILNVVDDFGADPTGGVDATSIIQSADAAAAAAGAALIFPGGTYKISGTITPSSGATWVGSGRNQTTLSSGSATATMLDVANGGFSISDFAFASSVTRTGGSHIVVAAGEFRIYRSTFNNVFTAITVNNGTGIILFFDVESFNAVNSAEVFVINGGDAICLMHVIANSSNNVSSNLYITNCGDLTCIYGQFINAVTNCIVVPGTGQQVDSFKCSETFFDHATDANLYIVPSGTGGIYRSNFDGCWFGSASSNNVVIAPASTAFADGLTFSNCEAVLCSAGSGVAIYSPATNITWNGGKIAGNDVGVFTSEATHLTFADVIVGASAGLSANTIGFDLGGGDYINIHDCQQLPSNTTAIGSGSTGTHNQIHDNPGYPDSISPTLRWTLDASGSAVTVANGANVVFAPGAGLIVIDNPVNGDTGVFTVGGGTVILIASSQGTWLASTSPSAGHTSIGWNGTGYALYNNYGSSQTFTAALIRTRASV